ncbi:hypothetical protein AALP_AA1G004700 [Arabis alpina]|uniref:RING-type E3 ubiquitin transferase n=1 Tax=Arabis alpina TaxID=50452 RepID=A0A087HK65_ARAAL|nr:hypothetical protein AALP_AA1G004700 [Arabis alpina]
MAEALNDHVYVAVSKDVGESKSTLLWALRTLRLKKLFLLHVHQPTPMNPTSSGLEQSEINTIHESEETSSYESLWKYRDICVDEGVLAHDVDILWIQADNVGEGIVELIYENNITKLIMGAAADSHYTEGMVNITSTKAKYVSDAPHCCKIWLVCNGNLIQTREGRFDRVGSSASLSSLHGLDSALILYEGSGSTEHGTESARASETMSNEEQRRRLESEEREQLEREREEALSSYNSLTQILYNEEVRRRRVAEEELNRAKVEIENMKAIQKELEEQLHIEYQRDEDVNANEELLRSLNPAEGEPSSHSSSSPFQWSVSDETPPYFICPITKDIMRSPHVAADGYTYEEEEIKRWLSRGGDKSPMTNLMLENHNLTPNHILRTAINDWMQQNNRTHNSL